MTWLLWGKLLLLAFSIWSLLVYFARRSDDKLRLREVATTHRTLRNVSPDEQAALVPLLSMPPTPGKPLVLKDDKVKHLYGPATQHSLSVQGNTVVHHAIGGVEVLLPYDAIEHLQSHNDAEVAITDRCAIVLRLNGTFELLEARERARLRQLADQQWAQGTSGAATSEGPSAMGDLKVLRQRTESELELDARLSRVSWSLAMGLLLGGIAALIASHVEDPGWRWLPWTLGALGAAGVGRWLLTRHRRPEPGKVNCAQGSLMQVSVTATGSGVATQRYVLGSTQAVEFPHHWLPFVKLGEAQVNMDVCVADQRVLRYRHLSVEEEQRRHPRALWGHHLLLAMVGGVLALATWLFSDDLLADAGMLRAWSAPVIQQPGNLAAGRLLDLPVQARCGLGRSVEQAVDCSQLHLQQAGEPVPMSINAPRPELIEWADGSRFDAIRVSILPGMWGWGGQALHELASRPVVISDVATLARELDALCQGATDAAGQRACGQVKMDLMGAMQTDAGESPEKTDWARASEWLKTQTERQVAVYAVLQRSDLASWKEHTQQIADGQLRAHVQAQLDALTLAQASGPATGVILRLVQPSPITTEGQPNASGVQAWRALQTWAGAPQVHRLHLRGLVTEAVEIGGRTAWVVDTHRHVEQVWRSALRCLLAALAVAMFMWHAPAFWLGFRRDDRQLQAIVEHWQRLDGDVGAGSVSDAEFTCRRA